ncbi:plasmid mobilization protein [Pseudomonas migulae]|uniref:Mobilization protein n=1 Tax=Pseudomonas migulae TaxID=78543 RepID=A0ABY8MQG8_9PSED|nr:hypothetical protein [Pseudomonas migulae]WGK88332.1 hypothetical protein MOQ58_17520 [Pseudomonas migulae]
MSEQDNFLAVKHQSKITTTRIHVKLKQELKRELEQKAANNHMSLSQLLLQSARNSTITIKSVEAPRLSKEMLVMTAAYNKFGAQLNMLAKHCNTFKEKSETMQILTALLNIQRSVAELKSQVFGEP